MHGQQTTIELRRIGVTDADGAHEQRSRTAFSESAGNRCHRIWCIVNSGNVDGGRIGGVFGSADTRMTSVVHRQHQGGTGHRRIAVGVVVDGGATAAREQSIDLRYGTAESDTLRRGIGDHDTGGSGIHGENTAMVNRSHRQGCRHGAAGGINIVNDQTIVVQGQIDLLRRCVGSRCDGGRGRVVLRGDADRDRGVCRQAVARSLSDALVVVVETIAQGDRTRRRLGIIGVGDGLGHTVDLIACDSRGKGQHQRAAAVGVGTNLSAIKLQNITCQVNTGAAVSGGAENVIGVSHRISAIISGHRQGGADEGVFMTGHQLHIQNRDVGVDDYCRAQHASLNTFDKRVNGSRIKPADCWLVIHRRDAGGQGDGIAAGAVASRDTRQGCVIRYIYDVSGVRHRRCAGVIRQPYRQTGRRAVVIGHRHETQIVRLRDEQARTRGTRVNANPLSPNPYAVLPGTFCGGIRRVCHNHNPGKGVGTGTARHRISCVYKLPVKQAVHRGARRRCRYVLQHRCQRHRSCIQMRWCVVERRDAGVQRYRVAAVAVARRRARQGGVIGDIDAARASSHCVCRVISQPHRQPRRRTIEVRHRHKAQTVGRSYIQTIACRNRTNCSPGAVFQVFPSPLSSRTGCIAYDENAGQTVGT